MIPKTAFFYWSGGELPWIREQALVSFQRLHPGWSVVLGTTERHREVPKGVIMQLDDITSPDLPVAARSDVWRYHMLAKHGGLYADTDVIFVRNVEPLFQSSRDSWITQDMGTPVVSPRQVNRKHSPARSSRVSISIGVLAAQKGSSFFVRVAQLTQDPAQHTPGDYQSCGTVLLARHWASLAAMADVGRIPSSAFYQGSSAPQVRQLWTEWPEVWPEFIYGLHWYGGSPESLIYLGIKSASELRPCWVRQALTKY